VHNPDLGVGTSDNRYNQCNYIYGEKLGEGFNPNLPWGEYFGPLVRFIILPLILT
jgi:hypothetical protein